MFAQATSNLKASAVITPRGPAQCPGGKWQDALQGLRLLALYRVVTPVFQVITMLVIDRFSINVMGWPVASMVALEVLVAAATLARLQVGPRVGMVELQLQAVLDISLYAAMLYLTGGSENPFAPLLVLPVMIVSIALPARQLWLMAIFTMACYAMPRYHHLPLSHPQGEGEIYELHEDGMVVNYILTSAMLVYFSSRLIASLRRHGQVAASAQEAQLRGEAVAAIGALAAGSAHELGSPLGTMSIITAELRHRYAADKRLQRDLQLIDRQLQTCTDILLRMADAGDQRRAEAVSGARLDEFILATVNRVQSLKPEATIRTQLDSATEPPWIAIEETLRHTIANVIQNAVRASPQHVQVAVDWSHGQLEVIVTDRGPGFSPEALEILGKRIDRAQRSPYGLGVALLLGAETLQRLGGSFALMNNADGGARVELRVPLSSLLINPEPHGHDAQTSL